MTGSQVAARRRRWVTPAAMLVLGGALTLATAIGVHGPAWVGEAVIAVGATAAFVVIGRTRTDLGDIVAGSPDERQRAVDLRATALTGLVLIVVILVGAMVAVARGRSGEPWIGLGALAGLTYLGALAVLRRR